MCWDRYYDFWDEFVRVWYNSRPNVPRDPVSRAYERSVPRIEFDELPTPYLGAPDAGASAVIINLNPGLSETIGFGEFAGRNSDTTQYWSNRNDPIGWMIREFRDSKNLSYREYINEWSCLNPALLDPVRYPQWCCGVHWWQGYDRGRIQRDLRRVCNRHSNMRIPWLQQVYNDSSIGALDVFALELCPFHSKKFRLSGNVGYQEILVPFIQKRVFLPAAMAVEENNLPFAVAVGSDVGNVLSASGGELEITWTSASFSNWPLDGNGEPIRRMYRMYRVRLEGGHVVRILVTSGGRVRAPSKNFTTIENSIRAWVNSNPL